MTLVVALVTGFGLSAYTLEDGRRVTAREYGAWYGWPQIGAASLDPYARASLARSGGLQLGRAEGISFHATSDENGRQLDGRCTYTISGTLPKSSAWSIQVNRTAKSGFLGFGTPNHQPVPISYLTNGEMTFQEDGQFVLSLAARAQTGNWLELPQGAFHLTLKIYDTNAFVTVGSDKVQLPRLIKGECT